MGDPLGLNIERNSDANSTYRLLVCSGPPAERGEDARLAATLRSFEGVKLICGGTTARIVAREWGLEPRVSVGRDPSGLPPTFTMPGVELITEGVLTLTRVKERLEEAQGVPLIGMGTDGVLVRMLLKAQSIHFLVGTQENPCHRDPKLPIELENRMKLIAVLAQLLERKFKKKVTVQYI